MNESDDRLCEWKHHSMYAVCQDFNGDPSQTFQVVHTKVKRQHFCESKAAVVYFVHAIHHTCQGQAKEGEVWRCAPNQG